LKEAARLLDQKKTKEASDVLLTALNTLMVVDNVTPLPSPDRAAKRQKHGADTSGNG